MHFTAVEPGPLPFADASFDIVFSKDAIIHLRDKDALYAETFRVLRPGGRLCVGDWLRGHGASVDPFVEQFLDVSGEEFFMQSLDDLAELVATVGFEEIETVDRGDWYAAEAARELERIRGPLRERFRGRFDEVFYDATVKFWERAVGATRNGALRPGHLRARKPVTAP